MRAGRQLNSKIMKDTKIAGGSFRGLSCVNDVVGVDYMYQLSLNVLILNLI